MYPYARRSKSLSRADMNRNKEKLDRLHKLLMLQRHSNSPMDMESGLSAADIHDIKSDIMRSIKLEQLK